MGTPRGCNISVTNGSPIVLTRDGGIDMIVVKTIQPARCICKKTLPKSATRSKATLAPSIDEDVTLAPSIDDDVIMQPSSDGLPCIYAGLPTVAAEVKTDDNVTQAKPFSEIPGPRGLPLLGNALKYTKLGPYSFEKILDNRLTYMRKYGRIYRERLGTMNMVHLFDPEDIATMFRQEGKYPSRGTIANLELTYLRRNHKLVGFAFRDGEEWARQRSVIQKLMMHPTAATRYLHWQIPVATDFAQYLGTRRQADDIVPTLYEDLFKYTMESVGSVAFGERLGSFDHDVTEQNASTALSAAIAETFVCFRNCMFAFPWYQYFRTPTYRRFENAADIMRSIMSNYVDKVQNRMRAEGRSWSEKGSLFSGKTSCPFNSGVLEESQSLFELLMSDDRVSHELAINLVMALLRTGIDSTGNALAFFLYNLATNPEKQQILVDEIQDVIPEGETLNPEHLTRMSYLKAALRESFRLHFPVFGGSGRVMPEDTEFSGYNVPKGVFIFANMAAMSRMDEYFPEPLEYHPERWLRDERANMRTTWPKESGFLSLGFSHGLRACPGRRFAEQGLYLAVVSILQKFRLEYEGADVGMIHMPFTTPDRPLNIKFISRD